jgi:hypothetical protein
MHEFLFEAVDAKKADIPIREAGEELKEGMYRLFTVSADKTKPRSCVIFSKAVVEAVSGCTPDISILIRPHGHLLRLSKPCDAVACRTAWTYKPKDYQ